MEKGVPIRSISRAISVLQAVNRRGSMSMMEIARASGVPYPTACRIVQTLLLEGLIERELSRKHYRATALVRSLSHGFQEIDQLVALARPHLVALTRTVGWPVSLATRVGHLVMLRDSTHALTSMTLNNYYPGFTMPLLECASGKLCIAYMSPDERDSVLATLRGPGVDVSAQALSFLDAGAMIEEIRTNGYAVQARNRHTANPGKTSSIAVPIFKNGELRAALTLIFFSSAIRMNKAVSSYTDELHEAADAISHALEPSRSDCELLATHGSTGPDSLAITTV